MFWGHIEVVVACAAAQRAEKAKRERGREFLIAQRVYGDHGARMEREKIGPVWAARQAYLKADDRVIVARLVLQKVTEAYKSRRFKTLTDWVAEWRKEGEGCLPDVDG